MILIRPHSPQFRVFSSGSFFTVWSFWATVPFALTVLGGYDVARTDDARLQGVAIAAVVHGAMGVIGLAGAAAERGVRTQIARAAVVALTIVAIGVLRPMLGAGLTAEAGLPALPVPMLGRVLTNLCVAAVALTIIALLVSTYRRRREVLASLLVVRRAFESNRRDDTRLVAAALRAVREEQARLRALLTAQVRATPPGKRAAALRAYSGDLVRPAAHGLMARSGAATAVTAVSAVSAVSAVREPAPHLEPALPRTSPPAEENIRAWRLALAPVGLPTACYVLVFLPYLAHREGLRTAALLAAVVGACGFLAELGVAWLVPRLTSASGRARATVVTLSYVLTAALLGVVASSVLGDGGPLLLPAVVYFLIALAIGGSVDHLTRLRVEEARLSTWLTQQAAGDFRGRRNAHQLVMDAAEHLHGDVQSACVTAAASMDRNDQDPEWDAALVAIGAAIARVSEQKSAVLATEQCIAEVLSAWGRVVECTSDIDPDVWPELDQSPATARVVVDALSEALANTLRHGATPAAQVRLARELGGVALSVVSPGELSAARVDGMGMSLLRRHVESVTLTSAEGEVTLRVFVRTRSLVQS